MKFLKTAFLIFVALAAFSNFAAADNLSIVSCTPDYITGSTTGVGADGMPIYIYNIEHDCTLSNGASCSGTYTEFWIYAAGSWRQQNDGIIDGCATAIAAQSRSSAIGGAHGTNGMNYCRWHPDDPDCQ